MARTTGSHGIRIRIRNYRLTCDHRRTESRPVKCDRVFVDLKYVQLFPRKGKELQFRRDVSTSPLTAHLPGRMLLSVVKFLPVVSRISCDARTHHETSVLAHVCCDYKTLTQVTPLCNVQLLLQDLGHDRRESQRVA